MVPPGTTWIPSAASSARNSREGDEGMNCRDPGPPRDGDKDAPRGLSGRCDGAKRKDDDLVPGETRGDFPGGVPEDQVFAGGDWELVHGGRSLAVSATAGIFLVVVDISEPSGPGAAWVLAALGGYFCALLGTATAERRLFREKEAEPPADGRAGGRMALLMAGLVFWISGEELGARLASWLLMAAVLLGGLSDGAWVALVSARRGVGLWRVWRALLSQGREGRRLYWLLLFGGNRGRPRKRP